MMYDQKWIWQQPTWPKFTWDDCEITMALRDVRFRQGQLLGRMRGKHGDDVQDMLDTLLANILNSSAIEGEKLNAYSVRSSLAKRLGVSDEKPYPTTMQTDNLAEMMLDAVQNLDDDLSLARILRWHEGLFPEGYTMFNPVKGGTLRGETPMQVVSGRIEMPTVHFEAPPRQGLEAELEAFIHWFNTSRHDLTLDPIIRAAITHIWFITLHPLEDGNGRITRLLTDLALAQAESQSIRFYAMSITIMEKRKSYYNILESTQRDEMNITWWIKWFLATLNETLLNTLQHIDRTVEKTYFWQHIDQTQLNAAQVKVLNRMLDGEFGLGINASQYQKVAKVSRATATRHLTALVKLGGLQTTQAGGRSTRYMLVDYWVESLINP